MSGIDGVRQRNTYRGMRAHLVGLIVLAILALVGCSTSPQSPNRGADASDKATPSPEPVSLNMQPADGASDVEPGKPITVSAEHGTLTEVTLTGEDGTTVSGEINEDRTKWSATEALGYGKSYTAEAKGKGKDGETKTSTATFSTATPNSTVSVSMNPLDGETVGVGQPLIFNFSRSVPDKEAAEQAIEIDAEPETEGAFYWFDDQTAHWRPKEWWKAHTKIDVRAEIYGKDLGDGVFGAQDEHASVRIGDKVVVVADGATHQMTVSVNDEQQRTMPISMGKPGYETPEGTYVVMGEHHGYTMDSSTYGVPTDASEGYEIWVETATRMSHSGIFYHSAPWSVWAQGEQPTSHGCINLSPEDARWLQDISRKGDPITVKNTGGQQLEPTDGWGDWQIPWEQWLKGGARNG